MRYIYIYDIYICSLMVAVFWWSGPYSPSSLAPKSKLGTILVTWTELGIQQSLLFFPSSYKIY
jgi:hypothetical protein